MSRRWLEVSLVVLVVLTGHVARAAVTASSNPVALGSVAVGSSVTSASVRLTSDNGTVRVDLSMTSACAAVFSFNNATNLNVNPDYPNLAVTFTPTARQPYDCTVTIYPTGQTTGWLGTFNVTGTGVAPVISTTPAASLDLGAARVNDAAVTSTGSATLTITNTSTDAGQTLSVNSITFTAAATNSAPGDFTIAATPTLPKTINPNNGSATWTITFNPSAPGPRNAVIEIATNDPITPIKTLTITGAGTEAVIGVGPDLAFGTVATSSTGAALGLTVSNVTTSNQGVLTAQTATITQSSTWFSFDPTTGPPGDGNPFVTGCNPARTACSLTDSTGPAGLSVVADRILDVRCAPPTAASGTQTATVTITSDSDAGGDSTATLTCTAGRPNIAVTSTSLALGSQRVGTSSPPTTLTVSNTGNANLTFYFARTGANASEFTATTSSGCGDGGATDLCTVAPGATVGVLVGLSPTSRGAKTATLVVTSNDPDAGDSPINVSLSGTGIAPIASPSPASLAFGNVEVGLMHAGLVVTLTNTGDDSLALSSASVVAGATDFAVTNGATGALSAVLAPGASTSWTLTCSPTASGARAGTFRVVSDSGAVAGTSTDVALSCTGLAGRLTISPATFDFGGVREGDTRTQNFTLANPGNLAVTGIDVVKDATLLGFTITAPATFPISLAAGASTTVTVRFAPATANEGCAVASAGDCAFTFSGSWGSAPTTASTSLVVTGDGLSATFDTSPAYPNPLDFGSVRFDQTATMPLRIINTGGSALQLRGLTITPGTAMTGEFSVVSCTHNGTTITCPSSATPFGSSGVNDTVVVNVRCNPNNRAGMLDATLTVSSDLNTATPDRVVPLRCTSTTAELVLAPASMVLDFGAVDLDATPPSLTRRISLTNAGSAPLDVGAATRAGASLARFAFTSTGATVIAPGASFDVDVTYTPTLERSPSQPDVASITFPLTGWLAGPGTLTVQLSGYGADRHIGVGPPPVFPDTFKNPGDDAPLLPVTISNTGYAPLAISAVMVSNEPIWTIANPDPVTIPPQSSHDFLVRFAPMTAGKAPTGRLQIVNDDDGLPMAAVDLDGNGRARDVSMGPRVIELGFTGIGIPIRLSELAPGDPLVVENADPVTSFRVARIAVDSVVGADGTFEIVDRDGNTPADLVLGPGGREVLDITFTPEQVGDFEATATLYLDQDPTPQAQVTLRGRGLYVDVRGGGGCSTTGSSAGGWSALVVAALLAGRRRRARRAAAAAVVVSALVAPRPGQAQISRNINLNVFEPTPATVGSTFQLQPAGVAGNGDWVASALVTYANSPLVLDTSQNDDAAVKNRTMLLVGGAFVFGGRFEAGARLPVLMQSGDPAGNPSERFGVEPASGTALGDATLHLKARVGEARLAGGSVAFGATGAVTIPTATEGQFAGTDRPTGRALLLGSLSLRRLTATLNVGGVVRERIQFASLELGSGALWGAGAAYRVADRVWAGAEVFGELIPRGKTGAPTMAGMPAPELTLHSVEGLAGVRYAPSRALSIGLAVGRGVTAGPGTPAFRGILAVSFTPNAPEARPLRVPRPPGAPRDGDRDGVADGGDDCPAEAEDLDLFEDTDGCPEPDNDADGLLDAQDRCPLEPEDRDRFQDTDGCPEPDNDGDGLLDAKDRCPLEAEDRDRFQDTDGCPEPDNDKDGVVDASDACPDEAEVINGKLDEDGCPDRGDALVILTPDRIEMLAPIQFSGVRVARSSENLLGQLAATLRAHPEVLQVRLVGHVNPTRNQGADRTRSEERVKAVRDWLVQRGVAPERLRTSGAGGERPLVPAGSKDAQEINDRIELIVIDRK